MDNEGEATHESDIFPLAFRDPVAMANRLNVGADLVLEDSPFYRWLQCTAAAV